MKGEVEFTIDLGGATPSDGAKLVAATVSESLNVELDAVKVTKMTIGSKNYEADAAGAMKEKTLLRRNLAAEAVKAEYEMTVTAGADVTTLETGMKADTFANTFAEKMIAQAKAGAAGDKLKTAADSWKKEDMKVKGKQLKDDAKADDKKKKAESSSARSVSVILAALIAVGSALF